MTFLEWEIYCRHALQEAAETCRELLATSAGVLSSKEVAAIKTLISLAEHVAEKGVLDEETNTWKIE